MKVPEPRQLPSGNWFIQLRLGGESIPVTERSRAACVKTAQLIKAQYLADREIVRKKLPPASELTLQELLDAYIAKYKPVLSPATVRGYQTMAEHRFRAVAAKKPGEVQNWQAVINAESELCGAKTLRNAWSLLCAALRDQKLEIPDVTLPQVVQRTRPWLDAEQIKKFVAAVRGTPHEIPIYLGLHGLRRSEIMALTWGRVDLKAGIIRIEGAVVLDENNRRVRKQTNKADASRRAVPIMIPELQAALEAVPKDQRKGPVVSCNINTIYTAVNRICAANGLPLVGAHGLRHSFASLGHHVGVPEHEMQLLGGWKDIGTMKKIYQHIAAEDLLKAQNAMAKFYQPEGTVESADAQPSAEGKAAARH